MSTEALWRVLSALLPMALALLGASVTLWPPLTYEMKYVWFGIFIVLGFAGSVAVLELQRLTRQNHNRLMRQILGEKNYCYLSVDLSVDGNLLFIDETNTQHFPLLMTATALLRGVNYRLSPVDASRAKRSPPYFSLDGQNPRGFPVHEGSGRSWVGSLPLGDYVIEFEAINGLKFWTEYLSIKRGEGGVVQTIKVEHRRTGEVLLNIIIPQLAQLKMAIL
jgi:hypothetical protein